MVELLNWHWPWNSSQSYGIFHICLRKAFKVLVSLWKLVQETQEDKWHNLSPWIGIPCSPGSSPEWEPREGLTGTPQTPVLGC